MAAIIVAVILGCAGLLYLGGMLSQLLTNYSIWMSGGGITGRSQMKPVSWNPLICFPMAFTGNGIKGMLFILLVAGAIFAYVKFHDRFDGKQYDPRGFTKSKSGIYGTASWMEEKEMKEVLEISPSLRRKARFSVSIRAKRSVCRKTPDSTAILPSSVHPVP